MEKSKNKSILYLFVGLVMLSAGCVKEPCRTFKPDGLPAKEQKLLGTWTLKATETYEVTGTDSVGQYQCNLIGSTKCDSFCFTEFKTKSLGSGSIGGCDPGATFTWKVKEQNKLETGTGKVYDITFLSNDSLSFSNIYVKDILTLKSVVYYKRK